MTNNIDGRQLDKIMAFKAASLYGGLAGEVNSLP
jgi:hypothetical protein